MCNVYNMKAIIPHEKIIAELSNRRIAELCSGRGGKKATSDASAHFVGYAKVSPDTSDSAIQ